MREIKATLWIKKAWTPSLQREGDIALMEAFTTATGVLANQVCLYLCVITLADITPPTGTYIPDGILTGKWQAGLDLEWSRQIAKQDGM